MQILATMLDHNQDGLLPTVLLDAIGRSDVAVLLHHPLFALSAVPSLQWTLQQHDHVCLHVDVNAYTPIVFDICFAWEEYGAWLTNVVKADRLRLIPVVDPARVEQSLTEPDAPGITLRTFAGELQPLVAHLKAQKSYSRQKS